MSEKIGIERDEIHEYKKQEMSSRFRTYFGPLFCIIGLHNWGPPKAVNSITLRGRKDDGGEWEHWTEDPSKNITQSCKSCPSYRERDNLDWEKLSDIQTGEKIND